MPDYKLVIEGGRELRGETYVSGGKNTSLAVVPATLLAEDACQIENLPDIEDIRVLIQILRHLGAKVDWKPEQKQMVVDPSQLTSNEVPFKLSQRMRASYYIMGALLGRYGYAKVGYPGGCDLGSRPIDQHLKGFRALGAKIYEENGMIVLEGKLKGANINFDMVTVGGTINVMLAACRAQGDTVLTNCAREPHIVDTANFLNRIGARIRGAGTDTIRIRGVSKLNGAPYTVIPDQIETGTLMIAAAATRGDVVLHGCIPTHMEALTAKLLEMGILVTSQDDIISVQLRQGHRAIRLSTQEYPGFPTDLQQPMSALLTRALGTSEVIENIFDSRFKHLDEMRKMGAKSTINGKIAYIEGVPELHGAPVTSPDLRGGAALVIAGLMAKGVTEIYNPETIARGYEHLESKLNALGSVIRREPIILNGNGHANTL
ncbi:MAG: UDP-N-acetylglucosamine 1-carboxyvinyltransferase [Clostridiales bacterium]|jgi:UDP-N-acetylglucosamine 1-carboxyvinyltransferase|nr:UDP-N-acetylglucosamine 1-carboxyvinyltransferase [Clostridiales bacterium]